MTFNSLQYAVFLPLVLVLYWRLPRRPQNALLLVASYLFYGAFDWRFLGLLMVSTLTDYTVGRLLAVTDDRQRRRRIFAVSLVVNLGILGFFKYFNFFTSDGAHFLGHFGIHLAPPVLRILLPVGISFYTFHGMSYTFDVYRRDIEPTRSLLDFAVFVAFFPQLVAGPIGRAHLQLPQFERDRVLPDWDQARRALFLILLGLFKKIAIADMLAPYANNAFGAPGRTSFIGLLVGVWAFAFEIYGDFSGYSDIARGSAKLLGIELPENFNQPYFSRSITEFWRRWHISLSTWLRDYLYIPLGGNRGGEARTYRNLMLTMLIGGLWHGAATTFVIWGGLHGLYLIAERRFTYVTEEDYRRPWVLRRDLVRTVVTFQAVCLAWVFFRSSSTAAALHYLSDIAHLQGGVTDHTAILMLALAAGALLFVDYVQLRARDHTAFISWDPRVRGLMYGCMIVPIIIFSGGTPVPFIYFRF
ncbi:MAG: alginate O-acetyltransferase complex protein AlgI [Acidimicrobiaceae bacterium]|nr:alginate O-acetyltransferase complex protein AlgI [Acidimicrobiaceae bacterium]